MSPGLEGTGRVADDLFLLAHNDVTGRPYIQPRPLGLGLAGALLAEAAVAGVIVVDAELVVAGRYPPREELAGQVLRQVVREPEPRPVGDWLAYLARTAAADVGRRLELSGYLTMDGRWWRGGRLVPVDRDSAFAPVLRVRAALDAARPPHEPGVVLAGLADACGLGFRLDQYTPARAVRPLHQAVAQLPPDLQKLIVLTRTAVDSALLAHRI